MKLLATGDIHLTSNLRDEYRHEFIGEILPGIVREQRPDFLFILGDLTEEKDRHNARLVNRIVKHFVQLAELCTVVVQRGNHDYIEADNPFFAFVENIPKIRWINKPWAPALKTPVIILPHTYNYKADWAEINFARYDLVFAHQTFQGAVGESGHALDGIPPKIFGDATVVSGDIHVPQAFDNIVYCGAPYRVDFGDDFDPRVLLIDTELGAIDSIPCPGKQKRLIEVRAKTYLEQLKRQSQVNPGDILKVRVELDLADHARWKEIQTNIRKWGADNEFNIWLVQPKIIEAASRPAARREISRKDDEELMKTYGKSRGVHADTLKTGLKITEET